MEFGPASDQFGQYFGLKEALEAVFGRPVDLVEDGASPNRYFLESMNKSRRLLYAASVRQVSRSCVQPMASVFKAVISRTLRAG